MSLWTLEMSSQVSSVQCTLQVATRTFEEPSEEGGWTRVGFRTIEEVVTTAYPSVSRLFWPLRRCSVLPWEEEGLPTNTPGIKAYFTGEISGPIA